MSGNAMVGDDIGPDPMAISAPKEEAVLPRRADPSSREGSLPFSHQTLIS